MKKYPTLLAKGAALLASLLTASAAILVGPTGSTVETFNTQPAATGAEWATGSFGTAAANYTTPAALDAALQDSYAEYFVTAVGSTGTQPPSPANIARRNTSASQGLYIQIRPNNDRGAVVLKATLQNDTGNTVNFLNVSYTFGLVIAAGSVAAEEIPGWRAFYSMDGEAYTWRPIPQFTTGTPGELAASLDVGEWAHGSTMFIVWVDDEAAAHNTAPNLEGAYTLDNFVAVPSAGRSPSLTAFRSSATGWSAIFEDGTGSLALNTSSFRATINGGTQFTPTVVKEGDVVTVSYTTPAQAPGTVNAVSLSYSNNAQPPLADTLDRTYTVNAYKVIPASFAVTGVDTDSSGMKARIHQIGGPRTPGDQNSTDNAERQLMDLIIDPITEEPYVNLATPSGEADGRYTTERVNWNIASPTSEGNFTAITTPSRTDDPVPGLAAGNTVNFVAEFISFVELRAGQVYTMGVNSDDGFKVTVGPNPRDVSSMVLGGFNGGRGFADTLFDFMVEADGIYPMRLLWWQGTGGGSVEWFTMDNAGNKTLLNDREVAGHVKAYSVGPATGAIVAPYVSYVSPFVGNTNAPANLVLEVYVQDAATSVSPSGIQLFVNDVNVTANATIAKAEGATRSLITYDPPGDLAPETRLNVRVVHTDSASTARTSEFWVQVKPLVLVAIDDVQNWRLHAVLEEGATIPHLRGQDLGTAWRERGYEDTAANGWIDAKALIADETGATAEPIRTPINKIVDPVNAPTISAITMYTRTHFNFDGNPGAVLLLLRHVVDDGAVFYLNGIEIYRFGVGATVNPVLYTTTSGGNENASRGPFVVPRAALRVGDNVFAVETHQESNTSSDIVFGAELMAVADPNPTPARISSTTPANNALNVRDNAPIEVLLVDGATTVNPDTVRLLVNGQPVAGASVTKEAGTILTRVNYTPTAPYPNNAVTTVTVEFRDNLNALRTETFSFTVLPKLLVDISATQMWQFHAELDSSGATPVLRARGEDLGTTWREPAYEDTAANGWVTGAALFADETGNTVEPVRTRFSRFPVLSPTVGISAIYGRTRFNFTGDPATAQLRIRHAVDDGAVVYLNGQEIHRFWIAAGDVTYATLAGVGFTPTDHEAVYEGPFDVPATALVQGENVLAVEVHQNGTGSSDIVMGVQLQWMNPGAPPVESRFTNIAITGGQVRIEWTGPGVLQESTTLLPGSWNDVTATSPYSPPGSNTGAKFFRFKP